MAASSSAASSSGAFQPTEQVNASQLDMTQVWVQIHNFGRFPKKLVSPKNAAELEEDTLWNFLYNAKKLGIPDDVWGEMRNYGVSQPVDATQRLIAEIKKLGRIPICSRTNKCERQLYERFAKAKKNDRFNDAQKIELEELRTGGPVALSDAARRACNEATLSWARGCNKYSTGERDPKHRRIHHKDGTDVDVFGTVWQKSKTSCFDTHPEDFNLDQWEASSRSKSISTDSVSARTR